MVRNRRLSQSISDAGWAQFRAILEAKAAYARRHVVAVPAQYTSQDCSGCGARVRKSLSGRTHVCTSCGLIRDRDENAALNILWAGQARRGAVGPPAVLKREAPSRSGWGACHGVAPALTTQLIDVAAKLYFG